MYTINDAHKKGVTAVASSVSGSRLISGGGEGQVRVWEIHEVPSKSKKNSVNIHHHSHRCRGDRPRSEEEGPAFVVNLLATLKEHANAVSCIKINKDGTACASSSADGTCIVWSLT